MTNERVRSALRERGVRQWELARAIGIRPETLCTHMRNELASDEQDELIEIILEFPRKRRSGNGHVIVTNMDIRKELARNDIYNWELAEELGINESTLTRWMRKELQGDQRTEVERAINRLIEKKGAD